MAQGIKLRDIRTQFAAHAGRVGDLHTNDGMKSLYSIVFDQRPIYADDTRALLDAYIACYFLAPNDLFYRSEEQYNTMCEKVA